MFVDLSTVQRRLEDLEYQRLSDFTSDVCRVFENSRIFNPKDAPIVQCADILEKRFRENLVAVRQEIASRNPQLGHTVCACERRQM